MATNLGERPFAEFDPELAPLAVNCVAAASVADAALSSSTAAGGVHGLLLQSQQQGQIIELDRQVDVRLRNAAVALAEALETAADNDQLWYRLQRSTDELHNHPLTVGEAVAFHELVAQQLPTLLGVLGYRPPPPTEHWVHAVQEPVEQLLIVNTAGGAGTEFVTRARWEFRFLVYRLRQLVDTQQLQTEPNGDRAHPPEESYAATAHRGRQEPEMSSRNVLTATVRLARSKVIPASIAAGFGAGLGALVAGPPGAAAGAATFSAAAWAGGFAAAQALVTSTAEAATAHLLAARPPEPVRTDREAALEARQMVGFVMAAATYLIDEASENRLMFILKRAIVELLSYLDIEQFGLIDHLLHLLHQIRPRQIVEDGGYALQEALNDLRDLLPDLDRALADQANR